MRRRILLLTLGVTSLVVLAFAIPLAVVIGAQTAQRTERAVQNQARLTGSLTARYGGDDASLASALATEDRQLGTSTLVRFADGRTVGTLPGGVLAAVGDVTPSPPPGAGTTGGAPPGAVSGGPDPTLRDVPGGEVAVAGDPDREVTVVVFVSSSRLRAGATGWYLLLAGASLTLLALSAVAAVVVSRRISAPLTRAAGVAHELSLGHTDARAPTDGPREVAEVGTALNRLAGRIDELIAEERETVADLSHRLRTPLTALRLDADALRDPVEAERIGGHVATLERTLTAVIRAARRPEREGRVPSCDAAAVVRDRVAFWSALAEDQGREVRAALPSGVVPVRAAAADLAAALDALIENVLAHTPEGVPFGVDLAPTAAGAELTVHDAGPGLPDGAGVRGRSDRGSTGLGLSIAARCADASGGRLVIERPAGGGGVVRLLLGRP